MIRRSILLASLTLLACAEEEEPLHPPPCSSATAPVELLRSRYLSSLAPAGDGVVLSQFREVPPMNLEHVLRRIDSSGSGVDLAVGSSRVDLQACKLEYSIVSPK